MGKLLVALLVATGLWCDRVAAERLIPRDLPVDPPAVEMAATDPAPDSLRLPKPGMRHTLHHAALNDDVKAALKWIESGIPVDTRDDEGRTPLMVAAAFGNLAVAEALLTYGADPLLRDKQGEAAIHFAARTG